jgi:hypothetical protein
MFIKVWSLVLSVFPAFCYSRAIETETWSVGRCVVASGKAGTCGRPFEIIEDAKDRLFSERRGK